ncbi:MAG: large-conductance mechanosensitive channel protein MscL [Ignavibacteriales bacterium]|nr:large-conductance mechanosensitive channel protein MscL [Ignavibacteriales bacterium]
MQVVQEFKKFIMRGNVIDLAVAIIIGAAFGKIVTSLVNDIILPPVGLLVGGVNFSSLSITIQAPVIDTAGQIIKEGISINYGNFLQTIFDFLIIAAAIFFFIKTFNKLNKKEEPKPAPKEIPADIQLLKEIRDLLKK